MNKMFWKAVAIRAIKTMCQTAVALIGSGAVGILDVDWASVLSVSALAGLVSVLTNIANGLPEVDAASAMYENLEDMTVEEPEDSFEDNEEDEDGEENV